MGFTVYQIERNEHLPLSRAEVTVTHKSVDKVDFKPSGGHLWTRILGKLYPMPCMNTSCKCCKHSRELAEHGSDPTWKESLGRS